MNTLNVAIEHCKKYEKIRKNISNERYSINRQDYYIVNLFS